MNDYILTCENLSRTFGKGKLKTEVLADINLQVNKKDRVAIVGVSGSGKSTLMHLLGGLDRPDCGSIQVAGDDILAMSERDLSRFRNTRLGFVYQFHHLLPEFSALENVSIPLWLAKIKPEFARKKAKDILERVGLAHRMDHRPAELSGGERQRVAIARAMVHQPDIILADEPTGNLDTQSANNVFEIMNDLNIEFSTTLIMVTHDKSLAKKMDKMWTLVGKSLSPNNK